MNEGYTDLGNGLAGWNRGTVHIKPGPDTDISAEVELDAELRDGRYRFTALRTTEITSKFLRSLSLSDALLADENEDDREGDTPYIRGTGWRMALVETSENKFVRAVPPSPRGEGPTEEALKDAALIYRVTELFGGAPVREIARILDMPRPTAASWVKLARAARYLPRIEP